MLLRSFIYGVSVFFLVSFIGKTCTRNEQNARPKLEKSNVEEIIVVCKTHFDIGYTHKVDDLIPYYRTSMIDKALAIMEQSEDLPEEQQFVWTAPAWVMSKVLEEWEGQDPERISKLENAFKSGRFVAHALPFTSHSDIMSAEEFARGIQYSSDVSEKYGLLLPRDAKVTDVPSHSTTLATGLANSGVKFIHIGCNWPSGSVDYPPLFWWEGPDGSKVLTMYSSIYSTCTALWPEAWGGNKGEDHPGGAEGLGTNFLPPKNWPHKVWLAILVTPDNSGPPQADDLKPLFDEVAQKMPGVKIRMGRMQDFADAIISSGADLPVVKKEAPDTWIHGVMSDPGGIKTYRNLQPLVSAAEALNTQLLNWKFPIKDAREDFNMANEQIMLYAEHTWGMAQNIREFGDDFFKLPKDTYKRLEESWEDKTNYIRIADTLVRSHLKSDLTVLANAVAYKGERIVVYNPLPYSRSEMIKIPGSKDSYFFAEEVPACGYKTFPLERAPSSEQMVENSNSIENEYYKISFNVDRGFIKSLIDKQSGREWIDPDASQGLGQYLNERFTYEQTLDYTLKYQDKRAYGCFDTPVDGDWPHPGIYKPGMISDSIVPYRAASPRKGTLRVTKSDHAQIAILEMPGDKAYHLPAIELHVRLESGMPYVEIVGLIKDKNRDNWPEADWLCLPFNIENPSFTIGRALGTIDPESDILPGSNMHLYALGSGVSINDSDGSGVAICPLDHPLVSLGQPGIWKFSKDYVPSTPIVYLNMYNNMWNTNFRYWYPGSWSTRVRLWTFNEKENDEAAFQTKSIETRLPMMAVVASGNGGKLPKEQKGITSSRKGVVITAYNLSTGTDGGFMLRVWEQAGNSGELILTLPPDIKVSRAQAVNLRGEKTGNSFRVRNGKLSFNLGKYAPASFKLTP